MLASAVFQHSLRPPCMQRHADGSSQLLQCMPHHELMNQEHIKPQRSKIMLSSCYSIVQPYTELNVQAQAVGGERTFISVKFR